MPLPEHLKQLAARVSNWGRWGSGDQRGTLNYVDADAVLRGISEVRRGAVFSLAIPMNADGPMWDAESMPGRVNPELDTYMVNTSFTGDPADFTTSDDTLTTGSQAVTHWDALAHVGYEGRLYNDTPMEVVSAHGAARLGVEHFGPIVTRGLLVDVARQHDVERFDANYAITAEDLDRGLEIAGLRAQPGDALVVRTGQLSYWRDGDKERFSHPAPGLSTQTIEWISEQRIAAVAVDNQTFECYPAEDAAWFMPVHMIHLRDMGLAQGQIWDLDELAADCADDGRYAFLLVASPLPVTGAAGAPVVPTAVK